jgi:hypothetical protein
LIAVRGFGGSIFNALIFFDRRVGEALLVEFPDIEGADLSGKVVLVDGQVE